MRLRTFARSLPERLSPISRDAYLSGPHRIAPAALALLTTGMVFVQRGDSGKPKPPSTPTLVRQVQVKLPEISKAPRFPSMAGYLQVTVPIWCPAYTRSVP